MSAAQQNGPNQISDFELIWALRRNKYNKANGNVTGFSVILLDYCDIYFIVYNAPPSSKTSNNIQPHPLQ